MMKNKWVQASLLLGVAVGVFVGGLLPIINPMINVLVYGITGIWALYIASNARGTDGW